MEAIKNLRKKITKWRIAQELGVSWQAVHSWEKGFNKPTKEHQQKLDDLVNRYEEIK